MVISNGQSARFSSAAARERLRGLELMLAVWGANRQRVGGFAARRPLDLGCCALYIINRSYAVVSRQRRTGPLGIVLGPEERQHNGRYKMLCILGVALGAFWALELLEGRAGQMSGGRCNLPPGQGNGQLMKQGRQASGGLVWLLSVMFGVGILEMAPRWGRGGRCGRKTTRHGQQPAPGQSRSDGERGAANFFSPPNSQLGHALPQLIFGQGSHALTTVIYCISPVCCLFGPGRVHWPVGRRPIARWCGGTSGRLIPAGRFC